MKTTSNTVFNNYSISANRAERRYRSFLLRFWQEEPGAAWRIQVEHPHTREVTGFVTMEQLVEFLDVQLKVEE